MTRTVVLGLLLGLAGCTAAGAPPERTAPPAASPSPAEERVAATPRPPAGPFTLERAIDRALEANPDVAIARERLEQALAGTREVNAAFLPALDGRLAWTRTDDPLNAFGMLLRQRRYSATIDPNDPGDRQDVRPDVTFRMNLFRGLADVENRRAALDGEEAAREGVAATRNAIASATIETFFSLAKAERLVPVAEESVRAVDAALEDVKAREAAGQALAGSVLSLEARRSETRDVLVRARHGVELARAALRALLALPGDVPLEVLAERSLDEGSSEIPSEDAAIARALENRAELRAVRAQRSALEHAATAAAREANPLIPRIDAFATYGVDSRNLRFNGTADNWTVGVAADWSLFAGGRDLARARRAESRVAEAREAERKAALEVELEVRRALLGARSARERITTAAEGARAAVEAHRVVKEQLAAGTANVTRFLEAEVALRDARAREITTELDARIARAALARALGEAARPEGTGP